ncbi:rhodanese-like domain-containing protein [Alkalihalobacterium alkalinitrilicum]|uniref:rhodanese-like domain-containing protein n=1 Tax=Alkalihalobacterium alkalinitrilicum TaxID=427920 RepID=UPI000995B773|nr:rhodanese-like domain-containing protein [Alkalihalobacterium alkalinitrilicum]
MKQKIKMAVFIIAVGVGVAIMFFGTSNEHIQEITTYELATKMKTDKNAIFIDVREVEEFSEAHVEGMTNIPLL